MATINSVGNSLSGVTGTGSFVGSISPSLVTPALGVPASGTLTNCTGLPVSTGISGLGTGVATALAANVNGSGAISLTTSPTFVTPTLGAASATSINFGGTSLANYVEGTWTPILASTGGGTVTYAGGGQVGGYTRIGNRVFFDCYINISASALSAGSLTITGLPLTAGSQNFGAAAYYSALGATAITSVLFLIQASSTSINLFKYSAGTTSALAVSDVSSTLTFVVTGHYHV